MARLASLPVSPAGADGPVVLQCILIGLGLQHKTVDELAKELDLAASQLLGLFNRTIRKLTQLLKAVSRRHQRLFSRCGHVNV